MLQELEIKKLIGTFNDYLTSKTCKALSTLLSEPVEHKLIRIGNGCDVDDASCLPSESIKMCSVRLNGKGDLHIELLFALNVESCCYTL